VRISTLFVLWKLRCKVVFDHKVISLSSFYSIWKYKVGHQLLAKGALLINDAQSLDLAMYTNFISALVALRKRLW
jgi:hypothetical protein